MRYVTAVVCVVLISPPWASSAIWKEDFESEVDLSDFVAGEIQLYSPDTASGSVSVKSDQGVAVVAAKGRSSRLFLAGMLSNDRYQLTFDIYPKADADTGYARSIHHKCQSNTPWLIEFKPTGGILFYTADSQASAGWAVRARTRLALDTWYRVRIENEPDRCTIKIHDRASGNLLWSTGARHNTGGQGMVTFQTSGKHMGMLLDNIELTFKEQDMRTMATAPGVKRLIDVWAPATALESYNRIVQQRPADAADAFTCWLADVLIRDERNVSELKRIESSFENRGAFSWARLDGSVYFCNGLAGYIVRGNSLWSLYHFGPRVECLSKGREDVPLWKILLKSKDGKDQVELYPTRRPQVSFDVSPDKLVLRLQWKNLAVAKLSGTIDVSVTATLPEGDSVARWRIDVTNRLKNGGLWEVFFPVVGNLGYVGESDVCGPRLKNPRPGLGDLTRRCTGPLSHMYMGKLVAKKYPGGGIQMISVSCGSQTVAYIACHDGEGYSKGWQGSLDDRIEIFAYPEGTAQPEISYHQPYDTLLGPMKGDWFDAAQRYRRWALQQKWCAAGPIAQRNIPERFKNVDFVLRTSLWEDPGPEKWNKEKGVWELTEAGRKMRQACGRVKSRHPAMMGLSPVEQVERQYRMYHVDDAPMVVHTYMWHQNLFDDMYPDFLPPIDGFKELVAQWQSKGLLVMPYINGWMLDRRVPWFEQAKPYLARKIDGGTYDFRSRINTSPQVTPCVYTKFWQRKIAGLARVICKDLGCEALYIDQTAAMPPVLCFDKTHGHPVGGGNWFGNGQRKLFEAVRKAGGKPIYLSSEWFCEYYIDLVDDFLLIWGTHGLDNAPLLPAVYGGYTNYHGTRIANGDDLNTIKVVFGRALLWGTKFGHIISLSDVQRGAQDYIRKLVRLRSRIRKFVQLGEMLRPPKFLNDVPRFDIRSWDTEFSDGVVRVLAPAVERSLWRAPDGSLGLVLVNYSSKAQEVVLDSSFAGAATRMTLIDHTGITGRRRLDRDVPLRIMVPAGQGLAVEIVPIAETARKGRQRHEKNHTQG